jgi:hypothetical protein
MKHPPLTIAYRETSPDKAVTDHLSDGSRVERPTSGRARYYLADGTKIQGSSPAAARMRYASAWAIDAPLAVLRRETIHSGTLTSGEIDHLSDGSRIEHPPVGPSRYFLADGREISAMSSRAPAMRAAVRVLGPENASSPLDPGTKPGHTKG